MTNQTAELLKYYNCISNPKIFKDNILNDADELFYKKSIKDWVKYRNDRLPLNHSLSERIKLLQRFNNKMGVLLEKILFKFKGINEWKEKQTNLNLDSIGIAISHKIQPLYDYPTVIKINYDSDPHLASVMQEYCLNGLELMIVFLKDELLIDIKNAPCYSLFENLINSFQNCIDSKKAILINQNTKLQNVENLNLWELAKDTAQRQFNKWIEKPETKNIISNDREIETELTGINDKILQIENSNLRINDDSFESKRDVEVLRILDENYYPKNPIKDWAITANTYLEFVLKRNYLESLQNEPQQNNNKPDKKYTAKDYALTYIFDLDVKGEQPPTTNGALDYKKLNEYYNQKAMKKVTGNSGFVKEVKNVSLLNRNNENILNQYSLNWKESILNLSENKFDLENYLKVKQL